MAALCSAGCGFYGSEATGGLCSVCFRAGAATAAPAPALSGDATAPGAGSTESVHLSVEHRVPTQFDEFTLAEGEGNQCAWCAHHFALRAPRLVAAIEAQARSGGGSGFHDVYRECMQAGMEENERGGGSSGFGGVYRECMQVGSAHRQAHCASGVALPIGENVDDPCILRAARAAVQLDAGCTDPRLSAFRIVPSAPGSMFEEERQLVGMMFPQLAPRILAATDEARCGPAASLADFRASLAALPPLGACVLERHVEAMAIIRTRAPDRDSGEAYLICDSHSPRSGLTDLEGAVAWVLCLIPGASFPLVFAATAPEHAEAESRA